MSWLLITISCVVTADICVIHKSVMPTEASCIEAAADKQARMDELGKSKFVIICRKTI